MVELIVEKIHKPVISQISARSTAKPLGFLSLISELCNEFGVQVPTIQYVGSGLPSASPTSYETIQPQSRLQHTLDHIKHQLVANYKAYTLIF